MFPYTRYAIPTAYNVGMLGSCHISSIHGEVFEGVAYAPNDHHLARPCLLVVQANSLGAREAQGVEETTDADEEEWDAMDIDEDEPMDVDEDQPMDVDEDSMDVDEDEPMDVDGDEAMEGIEWGEVVIMLVDI